MKLVGFAPLQGIFTTVSQVEPYLGTSAGKLPGVTHQDN